MNKTILSLSVAIGVALAGLAHAADIVPVNFDSDGEGYNDPAAVAPVPGNPGTTRGLQRQIVAQFAADLWGSILVSTQPVYIGAQFNPLGANVLGQAGSANAFSDEPEFPLAGTWYGGALGDALTGRDLDPGFTDINSQFSSDFNFYYGLDGNTPAGQVNFLDVVMHEYGHGLGFANFENETTGRFFLDMQDIYSVFTFDNTTQKFWTAMTIAERQTSARNYGKVVFTGNAVTAGSLLNLGPRSTFRVFSPAGIAGDYDSGTASFGAPVTPANFSGTVVAAVDVVEPVAGSTTLDGCSPFSNAAAVAGNIALVNRGGCGFVVKAANAQAAGATGLIVANNVAGSPAPGLGGTDPSLTIPTISLTQPDGNTLRSVTGAQVGFVVDGSKLQGADDLGRARLFMPNPVQSGSSGSHFDTATAPNTLMEPAINDSLNAALHIDMTAALMKDIGWQLNTGNAKIAGCDTTIKIIDDAGFIIGANVQATSNLIAATSPDKATYQARMSEYKDRMVAGGLITGKQGGKMMQCAAKIVKNS